MQGDLGVPLYFSISGFVLTSQILKTKRLSYTEYILRRVERIEPPFLITTLVLYFALSYRDGFSYERDYSLFRVLTYTINFSENLINVVTWFLEIEIVFYLLLPLMFTLMKCDLKKWVLITILIFFLHNFYQLLFLRIIFIGLF